MNGLVRVARSVCIDIAAVVYGVFYALRQNPGIVVIAVFLCLFLLAGLSSFNERQPPETAEQVDTRRKQQLKEREDAATVERLGKALCRLQSVCAKFSEARQQCATAGNFDKCVSVKLGDDYGKVYFCRDDGKLRSEPSDMPGVLRCSAVALGDYFGLTK